MFGLMRFSKKDFPKSHKDYHFHRMHYCGVCKTLGLHYGHKSRVFLNFDTVFFAELLSYLSNEKLKTWETGFQAINKCLRMPNKAGAKPFSLKYAAAANVLLGALKLDDHEKDFKGIKWKILQRFFSGSFRKATLQFKEWGVDTKVFWYWIKEQDRLETGAFPKEKELSVVMDYFANPTAQITSLIFEQAATLMNQKENETLLKKLGDRFGRLVYALDAYEDLEKDFKRNHFNPILGFYKVNNGLKEEELELVRQHIMSLQESLIETLLKLPLAIEVLEDYSVRLYDNVVKKLYPKSNSCRISSEQMMNQWEEKIDIQQLVLQKLRIGVRTVNRYMVSAVILVLPTGVDLLTRDHQTGIYKALAILFGFFAAIGIGRQALSKRQRRKAKRKFKRARRRLRFAYRFKKGFLKQFACWEICCEICLDPSFCDCMVVFFEELAAGEKWPLVLLVVLILLLLIFAVFV